LRSKWARFTTKSVFVFTVAQAANVVAQARTSGSFFVFTATEYHFKESTRQYHDLDFDFLKIAAIRDDTFDAVWVHRWNCMEDCCDGSSGEVDRC
jgi:protein associated with RNAse G/E